MQVIASDAHDTEHRQCSPPGRDAVAKIVGTDIARALVEDNPAAIVAGEALPYLPAPVSR